MILVRISSNSCFCDGFDGIPLEFNKTGYARAYPVLPFIHFPTQPNLSKLLDIKGCTRIPKSIYTRSRNNERHCNATGSTPQVIMSSVVKPFNFCSTRITAPDYRNEDVYPHEMLRTNSYLKQLCVLKETMTCTVPWYSIG